MLAVLSQRLHRFGVRLDAILAPIANTSPRVIPCASHASRTLAASAGVTYEMIRTNPWRAVARPDGGRPMRGLGATFDVTATTSAASKPLESLDISVAQGDLCATCNVFALASVGLPVLVLRGPGGVVRRWVGYRDLYKPNTAAD